MDPAGDSGVGLHAAVSENEEGQARAQVVVGIGLRCGSRFCGSRCLVPVPDSRFFVHQNAEPGTQDQNLEPRTRTQNLEPRTQNLEPRTQNPEPGPSTS